MMVFRQILYSIQCLVVQYWPRRWIAKLQQRKLRKLISEATADVEFYRCQPLYQEFLYESVAFERLPVITKKHLRTESGKMFRSDNIADDRCVQHGTSGTTGEPVTIFHKQDSYDYHTAAGVRRALATGAYRPTYRILHIRPAPLPKRFYEYFGLFRRDIIPAELPIVEIKQRILRERPQALISYPVYLRDLVRSMTPDERQQARSFLKVIFTESELLSEPIRRELEGHLGTKIFDDYSAYETLSIGFECAEQNLHICEDRVLVEIMGDNGQVLDPGQEGRIVVTNLDNRAMPIIRYDLGDKGILSQKPCGCGRKFATLRLTQGRCDDFITLGDGQKIYNLSVLQLVAELRGVEECFLRQAEKGDIEFFYIPTKGLDTEAYAYIERAIDSQMRGFAKGNPLSLKIVRTDKMPLTKGGKSKLVESLFRPRGRGQNSFQGMPERKRSNL